MALEELTSEQIKQVLQGISIPPQPQIMVDLQMEQMKPVPDVNVISDLICQDPGLAGSLLKIINSAYYGLPARVVSIKRAIFLLGINSVINIVNAQSIKGAMSDETIRNLSGFWDNAQRAAMTCTALAKVFKVSADEAYALGLFCNCGIPLMLKRFPYYMSVLESAYTEVDEENRIVDMENRAFKTNHAVIGYYIARSWHLPAHISEVISEHHNALNVFTGSGDHSAVLKRQMAVLKVSEHLCETYRAVGGQVEDLEWRVIREPILDYLGISMYELDRLYADINALAE